MFVFLAFVFILVMVVWTIGFTLVGSIIKGFFGSDDQDTSGRRGSDGQDARSRITITQQGRSGKKVFGKDEGEYVDYVDVEE